MARIAAPRDESIVFLSPDNVFRAEIDAVRPANTRFRAKNLIAARTWRGPTRDNFLRRLRDEVVKALNAPDIRQRLAAENCDIIGSTPEEFGAKVKRDVEKMPRL